MEREQTLVWLILAVKQPRPAVRWSDFFWEWQARFAERCGQIQRVANSNPTGRIHRWHEAVGSAGIPTVRNSFENFNASALDSPNLSENRFRDHIVCVACPRWLNPNGAENRSHRG